MSQTVILPKAENWSVLTELIYKFVTVYNFNSKQTLTLQTDHNPINNVCW